MGWGYGGYGGYAPYVSVAERRANARREVAKLAKQGRTITPVELDSKTIARTFWGKAWCDLLESYGDYASRMPRGRSYVRNGSVVDLQIAAGQITALVSGSELYEVDITITPLPPPRWKKVIAACAGAGRIDSVIALLEGKLSDGVLGVLARQGTGLFPLPAEITFGCSCPDIADMCKHIAATLYGVGARLDTRPELFFLLRQVDQEDLISQAGVGAALSPTTSTSGARSQRIDRGKIASVFGIELSTSPSPGSPGEDGPVDRTPKKSKPAKKKAASKKKPAVKKKAAPKKARRK